MATQVQIRRGSATEHDTFTGAVGEITMDTTNKTIRVHDGQTPGGIPLARMSDIPESGEILDSVIAGENYIDITLGANGATYTMPNSGWLQIWTSNSRSGYSIGLYNKTSDIGFVSYMGSSSSGYFAYVPVRAGDKVVAYHYNFTPNGLRLHYPASE